MLIPNAEVGTGADMIEVRVVTVADHKVGPVWFTVRPDKNLYQYAS
jgi:hypothetical protein